MMLKKFKKLAVLSFEITSLFYLLVVSVIRFLFQINLGSISILPVIISASILVFVAERNYFKSYIFLLKGKISMNLLIAIACHLTYFYSLIITLIKINDTSTWKIDHEFWETPIALFTLFRVGKVIENKLKNTSMKSKYEIMQLKNQKSLIISDGKQRLVDIKKIKVDDLLYIPKGAMITADSELITEIANLDVSSITGETGVMIYKKSDEIFSGSINLGNPLICKVIRKSEDSKLGRILQHLENMMDRPTRTELITQRIIKFFVPSTLLIVIITFLAWLIISYTFDIQSFISTLGNENKSPFGIAIQIATSVLVIACPCAFGIAAPIAIYSSSIVATDNRILFSDGEIFERLLKIKYAVFDKTGTITENISRVDSYFGDKKELSFAFKLSSSSNHPISMAITKWLKEKEFVKDDVIESTSEIMGVGVEGYFQGIKYQLVSKNYSDIMGYTRNFEFLDNNECGQTMLVKDKQIVGIFLIKDVIRENSKITVEALKRIGITCFILSGDSCKNVKKVANYVGINNFKCQLSPEMKMEEVKKLGIFGDVVYIGDGINDVLATKAANLSISFESGTDLNKSLADITIIDNDIFSVYKAILLSRRTIKTVRANFIWALLFNMIFLPLSIVGFIIPWLGMVLMMISSITLILHTLIKHKLNQKIMIKSLNSFKLSKTF